MVDLSVRTGACTSAGRKTASLGGELGWIFKEERGGKRGKRTKTSSAGLEKVESD